MKSTIYMTGFAVLLGTGLMSCSMVEGAIGSETDVSTFGGFVDTLWGLAKGFIPSLAAWEGCGSIFSPRKRQHYTNMVMAVVPLNKNVEFGEALKSLGSGLGLAHSSDATKDVHCKEVNASKVAAVNNETKA
tara:strand:- start:1262 stop:1657 length:396 start_codon:yes stop_codon:yes gene_type:complete